MFRIASRRAMGDGAEERVRKGFTADGVTVTAARCSSGTLQALLERWQATGCHEAFGALLAVAGPIAERVAACTLRRCGIRDPATADDAVALVFDHLRRLPGTADERCVAPFVARTTGGGGDTDAGRAFIVRLSHDRALDVAQAVRRRSRKCILFCQLDDDAATNFGQRLCDVQAANALATRADEAAERLQAAIARLDPRQRRLVALLIEGKNQAVIAHVLGVCEGTVSRIRRQALDRLRALLDGDEP